MNINELSLFTIFFIIILIIGLYKTSKKILRKDNNNIIENLERLNEKERNNGN